MNGIPVSCRARTNWGAPFSPRHWEERQRRSNPASCEPAISLRGACLRPAISGRTRCARDDASGSSYDTHFILTHCGGRIKNSVLATGHVRALLTTTQQIDSLPSHDPEKAVSGFRTRSCAQKREAERRKAHAIHVRVIANKRAQFAPLICSAAARPFGARPPFGAHACGTRQRLLSRWLSPRTGFPEDGPSLGFCPLGLIVFG
jgi:hypothetical protein